MTTKETYFFHREKNLRAFEDTKCHAISDLGEAAELLGQAARLFELCWLSWRLFHEPQAAQQAEVCSLLKPFALPSSWSPC